MNKHNASVHFDRLNDGGIPLPLAQYQQLGTSSFTYRHVDVVLALIDGCFDPSALTNESMLSEIIPKHSLEARLFQLFWYLYQDLEQRDENGVFVYNKREQEWTLDCVMTVPQITFGDLVESYPAVFYLLVYCEAARSAWAASTCTYDQMLRRWSYAAVADHRLCGTARLGIVHVLADAGLLDYVDGVKEVVVDLEITFKGNNTRYVSVYKHDDSYSLHRTMAMVALLKKFKKILSSEHPTNISSENPQSVFFARSIFTRLRLDTVTDPFQGDRIKVITTLRYALRHLLKEQTTSTGVGEKSYDAIHAMIIACVLWRIGAQPNIFEQIGSREQQRMISEYLDLLLK
jgi:hypothetical protein